MTPRRHHLFALVGPSAIGKTFWSNRMLERYAGRLQRVKNTTTREPRVGDLQDHESYHFVSRDEFLQGIAADQFLEHDQYFGVYYGSSLVEIRSVLKTSSGIFAITPAGAAALYHYRSELNLMNILLEPESEAVLRTNLDRRKEADPERRTQLLRAAEQFTLPTCIEHTTVVITGDHDHNEASLVRIFEPLLGPV